MCKKIATYLFLHHKKISCSSKLRSLAMIRDDECLLTSLVQRYVVSFETSDQCGSWKLMEGNCLHTAIRSDSKENRCWPELILFKV